MSELESKGYEFLNNAIDICYSPDDAAESGKGYYLANYDGGSDETSDLYSTRKECEVNLRYWQRKWGLT